MTIRFLTAPDAGYGTEPALGIVVALALTITVLAFSVLLKPKRRYFRGPYRLFKFDQPQRPDFTDVGRQLHAVMAASFEKRRVLSRSEYRVFAIIEAEIAAQYAGYRVFAQTSLGEILTSNNSDAFHSINSKRVDILVVDRNGWPFLAIEYQGDGHYQGTAAARDAVKKEALRKAGVKYVEFCAEDNDDKIRSRLREYFPNKVAVIR